MREDAGIKHLNDSKAFIEYYKIIDDVDDEIDGYNRRKERKIWFTFGDRIADIMADKKISGHN